MVSVSFCKLIVNDHNWHHQIWGVVEGGHDMDRLNNAVSLSAAGLFFGLIHDSTAHSKLISTDWVK